MNSTKFFASYKRLFGGLTTAQRASLAFLLGKLEEDPPDSVEHAAYMLATTKHETAGTFAPVKEGYWLRNAEAWRKRNLRYYPWYGRGYVQLTWEKNYKRAGRKLGLDLTTDADAVMEPEVSYKIMLRGMQEGWFTGKKMSDYMSGGKKDYQGARRIINGTDKAALIARHAKGFETALLEAGYKQKEGVMNELIIDLPTLREPFQNTAATKILLAAFEADLDTLGTDVSAFQLEAGLVPDGIVGPATWRAVFTT